MTRLRFDGLEPRPAQTWGAVRLVPLVRTAPLTDLRLDARAVGQVASVATREGNTLTSYVPHAFVATWTSDGSPAASYGTQLLGGRSDPEVADLKLRRLVHRQREAEDTARRLRFLPQLLALDGLLGLEFGGPPIAWAEYSRRAVRSGLSPRVEQTILGEHVTGLDDALRVFEVCAGQCGVLLYVHDVLVSAFVTPHPADYRALHGSLLRDLYGDALSELPRGTANTGPGDTSAHGLRLPDVDTIGALRRALAAATASWASGAATTWLRADLFGDELAFDDVYKMGPYRLSRFLPTFERHHENHVGEAITGADGTLAYLHTYRLSMGQVRRGRVLRALGRTEWNLDAAAADLGTDRDGFLGQLRAVGLDHVIRQDVMDAWRARRRVRK